MTVSERGQTVCGFATTSQLFGDGFGLRGDRINLVGGSVGSRTLMGAALIGAAFVISGH